MRFCAANLPEVESLRVQFLWLLKKALPSREEPDISLSFVNSQARFHLAALRAYIISPSALNTRQEFYTCILNV